MRFIISLVMISFYHLPVFSQENQQPEKTINGLDLFFIGDPLVKFDTVIKCAGAQQVRHSLKIEANSPCTVFKFLPAEKDAVKIGTVRFLTVILSSDKAGKIDNVLFLKYYGKTGSSDSKKRATADYDGLASFLSPILEAGETYTDKEDVNHYSKKGVVWKNKDIKYSLILTTYKKKMMRKLKVTHSIDFGFYKSN